MDRATVTVESILDRFALRALRYFGPAAQVDYDAQAARYAAVQAAKHGRKATSATGKLRAPRAAARERKRADEAAKQAAERDAERANADENAPAYRPCSLAPDVSPPDAGLQSLNEFDGPSSQLADEFRAHHVLRMLHPAQRSALEFAFVHLGEFARHGGEVPPDADEPAPHPLADVVRDRRIKLTLCKKHGLDTTNPAIPPDPDPHRHLARSAKRQASATKGKPGRPLKYPGPPPVVRRRGRWPAIWEHIGREIAPPAHREWAALTGTSDAELGRQFLASAERAFAGHWLARTPPNAEAAERGRVFAAVGFDARPRSAADIACTLSDAQRHLDGIPGPFETVSAALIVTLAQRACARGAPCDASSAAFSLNLAA